MWSTVGENGFILDLTQFSRLDVNAKEHQVTVSGVVLMKELSIALAEAGECAGMRVHYKVVDEC